MVDVNAAAAALLTPSTDGATDDGVHGGTTSISSTVHTRNSNSDAVHHQQQQQLQQNEDPRQQEQQEQQQQRQHEQQQPEEEEEEEEEHHHSSTRQWIDTVLETANRPLDLVPKAPNKCPLFCVFFAAFDIKVGPVVRHQCPDGFLDRDINIGTPQIHDILARTFQELKHQNGDHQVGNSGGGGGNDNMADEDEQQPSSSPPTVPIDDDPQQQHSATAPASPPPSTLGSGGQSIFDSTSEYIITGSELTGKIITLSTHAMHVMTRPTQIVDERYERNSLLFSIGIVLRRAADPRPFRSLISKLAMTLRSMEMESGVLSDPTLRTRTIQPLLERILISLNSPSWECNLLLDRSTALNLKLFHPPKPQTSPVHDHQVPVLLRRDSQLQQYEWDLAINWVILHIDGITNARQISIKAEVDLEMVLACLRVLKQHNVIAVVDMFLYSNRYEFTEKAAAMLAGKEQKLIQEAVDFCVKQPTLHIMAPSHPSAPAMASSVSTSGGSYMGVMAANQSPKSTGSPHQYHSSMVDNNINILPSSSYPPRGLGLMGGGVGSGSSHRSSNFRYAIMAANSLEREASFMGPAVRPEDRRQLEMAFPEIYCACNRNLSFGDIWLTLTAEFPTSLALPSFPQRNHATNKTYNISSRSTSLSGPSNYQRNASSRKNSLTDLDRGDSEVVAFSPIGASMLESLRRGNTSSAGGSDENKDTSGKSRSGSNPNWNEIFRDFDHRRFFTFGIVHGLVVRVHDYPYFPGPFFAKRPSTVVSQSSSSPLIQQNSHSVNSMSSMASMALSFSESIRRHKKMMKEELVEERRYQTAKAVASMMDGTRCDDELVCLFERPYKLLVERVEKYSGKKVVHIYATKTNGL